MTPQEFKSWMEGYSESIEERPTAKQWARIKERVAEIDGKPVTQNVYVDRYWPRIWGQPVYPYSPYLYCSSAIGQSAYNGANTSVMSMAADTTPRGGTVWPEGSVPCSDTIQVNTVWDGVLAMNDLGRADAKADAA